VLTSSPVVVEQVSFANPFAEQCAGAGPTLSLNLRQPSQPPAVCDWVSRIDFAELLSTPDGEPSVSDSEIGFVYSVQSNDTAHTLRALHLDLTACVGDFDASVTAVDIEPVTSVTSASVR
jgi:hypothetical protein